MSIKIYEAYRVPAAKLPDFLAYIRSETIKKALPVIQTMMSAIKPEVMVRFKKQHGIEESVETGAWSKRELYFRWEFLSEKFKEYYKQVEHHPFDVQSGLTLFPDGLDFYYWSWGRFQADKEIVLRFEGVKDFCYWDNTDKPGNVSSQEWNQRRNKWNQIIDLKDITRLTYYILDFSPNAYQSIQELEIALGFYRIAG